MLISSFLISIIITIIVMPFFISFMHRKQFGQEIYEDGPSWHKKKSGTPNMGGLVFLGATLIAILLVQIYNRAWSIDLLILTVTMLIYAGIGFVDDCLQIFHHQNEGLTAGQKFLAQIVGALIVISIAHRYSSVSLWFPLIGWTANFVLIALFAIFWLVGFSNAFNLTDGIDGLSSGCGIISLTGYFLIALKQGQTDIAVFCAALIGGLFGFLIFNMKPAKVFMGDAGSLAVGALLAMISILTGHPWSLLLIGLVYVVETMSVILQVLSYKTTGKRIFKMTPIHHHFELSGWSEWKIDLVFWAAQAIGTVLGVLLSV